MRRLGAPLATIALLAAGGFAAVSIASGGGLAHITTTGTTGLTVTTPGKVTLCHRTGSVKHPFVTITVAAPAVRAHLRHGDVLGRCTTATIAVMKRHGNKHTTTTTTTTTTASSSHTPGNSGAHGSSGDHGNSGDHGSSSGHGNSHH